MGGRPMTGDHLTVQGTLTTTILSNSILTLQIVEIYIFWEVILTMKATSIVAILTDIRVVFSIRILGSACGVRFPAQLTTVSMGNNEYHFNPITFIL